MIDSLKSISDVVGLVGVTLILLAFYLLNTSKLTSLNLSYQCMNLSGSILVLVSLYFHVNVASVVIEIAWMIISVIGIRRALRSRRSMLSRERAAAMAVIAQK